MVATAFAKRKRHEELTTEKDLIMERHLIYGLIIFKSAVYFSAAICVFAAAKYNYPLAFLGLVILLFGPSELKYNPPRNEKKGSNYG